VRQLRYLNFGCGPKLHADFINLDYDWLPGLDICCDVTAGLPLAAESLDGIFTEHCLEHIPLDACRKVMQDCRRVLARGAALRIVVPDAGLYAKLYARSQNGEAVEFPYHADHPAFTPMMHMNRVFREHGHLFAYDRDTFALLLKEAGFTEVAPRSFREGRNPKLLLDSEERAVESLYIEAYR
jgi:predicted SAM-dependent methyltransferase